jgi:hypothetical protein
LATGKAAAAEVSIRELVPCVLATGELTAGELAAGELAAGELATEELASGEAVATGSLDVSLAADAAGVAGIPLS